MATPPLPAESNPAGIGATVRITTSRDERIEGTVFTHDTVAGVVVIEQKGAGDKSTYRMLRSSAVKEVEVLAPPADERQWADSAEAELPVVDLDAVHARYERSIVKGEEDLKYLGQGVTSRGQMIFDAVRKTMPVEWLPGTQDFVVLREVMVSPPYTPENCRPPPGQTTSALPRVQKVLAGEIAKLGLPPPQ